MLLIDPNCSLVLGWSQKMEVSVIYFVLLPLWTLVFFEQPFLAHGGWVRKYV